MTGVLDGIRVLAMAQWLPSGAGYMLGDLGAEVIKIEQPVVGDTYRGMSRIYGDSVSTPGGRHIGFETVNRNQLSITINLKNDKGRAVFYDLVKKSDVFFSNFSAEQLVELGADYDSLARINPLLVYAYVSGYGPKGPWAKHRGFDFVAQAYSGIMFAMGDRDSAEPTQCVATIMDTMVATMTAYGIMAALLARERHGIGQKIDTSLLGSALHLQGTALNVASIRGRGWARHSRTKTKSPFSNFYKCRDGKWLAFSELQVERFWKQFCQTLGMEDIEHDPGFAENKARRDHAPELIKRLDSAIALKTRDEWLSLFAARDATFAYAPVNDYIDVRNDPQVLANQYMVDFDHPAEGKLRIIGYPVGFSRTPAQIIREAPELGQHTEQILTELCGYDWDQIGKLRQEGAI